MANSRIPCIIDTDPGVDDAFAILYAAKHPKLDLLAITSVFGNVSLDYTVRNAQLLAGLIQKPTPVALGHRKALVSQGEDAGKTHGSDGFGGVYERYQAFKSTQKLEPNSVQTLKRLIQASPEPVVLFPIGPMTNIAALLLAYPELKPKIRCISFMGGAFVHGNRTASAEFNILCDPEAAQIVLESGVELIMAGLDITDQALIGETELKRILAIGRKESQMLHDILDVYASHDRCLHDPIAVMAFTDPELFEFTQVHIEVETHEGIAKGATLPDFRKKSDAQKQVKVAMRLDHATFMNRLIDVLSKD